MKVKYVGPYDGFHVALQINVKRGEVYEVDDKIAETLIKTKQFKLVRPKKKEETTQMEVKKHG